jgi:hypothetical protein
MRVSPVALKSRCVSASTKIHEFFVVAGLPVLAKCPESSYGFSCDRLSKLKILAKLNYDPELRKLDDASRFEPSDKLDAGFLNL